MRWLGALVVMATSALAQDGGAAEVVPLSLEATRAVVLKAVPLLLFGAGALLRRDPGPRRWLLPGWAGAALLAFVSMPLALSSGGLEVYRYSYASLNAAVFTLLLLRGPGAGRR